MKCLTAFHCSAYRVIRGRAVGVPDHWRVQESRGYTDGTISWRFAAKERFWSEESAKAFVSGITGLSAQRA